MQLLIYSHFEQDEFYIERLVVIVLDVRPRVWQRLVVGNTWRSPMTSAEGNSDYSLG